MLLSSAQALMIGRVPLAHQGILGIDRAFVKSGIEKRVALAHQLSVQGKLVRMLRLFQQWIAMSDGNMRCIHTGPFLGLYASGCK